MTTRLLLISTLILLHSSVFGAIVHIEKTNGSTEFKAIGNPSALHIDGLGVGPQGSLDLTKLPNGNLKATGKLTMTTDSFKTGIGLRDRHMAEKYLEVDKFKESILEISNLELPVHFFKTPPKEALEFEGTLELHGVKRPIKGTCLFVIHNDRISAISEFSIKLSDFNIKVPVFAGITMAEEVKIKTSSHFSNEIEL